MGIKKCYPSVLWPQLDPLMVSTNRTENTSQHQNLQNTTQTPGEVFIFPQNWLLYERGQKWTKSVKISLVPASHRHQQYLCTQTCSAFAHFLCFIGAMKQRSSLIVGYQVKNSEQRRSRKTQVYLFGASFYNLKWRNEIPASMIG